MLRIFNKKQNISKRRAANSLKRILGISKKKAFDMVDWLPLKEYITLVEESFLKVFEKECDDFALIPYYDETSKLKEKFNVDWFSSFNAYNSDYYFPRVPRFENIEYIKYEADTDTYCLYSPDSYHTKRVKITEKEVKKFITFINFR